VRSIRLVAESLREVPDPTVPRIPAIRHATASLAARIVRAAVDPGRTSAAPPSFLRPGQVDSWRRAIFALDGWHGVVIAEPVGSGKTWIALAVAASRGARPAVLGPAALRDQWLSAADRAAISIGYHSLERISRGHLPAPAPLVIIDEAHRLRHLETRRVHALSPWLTGSETVMLTATPVVNRRRDLLNLLALLVADDALRLDGIPSIRELARYRTPPPALRRLVIRSPRDTTGPALVQRTIPAPPEEGRRGARMVAALDRLALSDDAGVRALLRLVLLDAGASSDAAWHDALRRYRDLILQSRDAGGASRAAVRRLAGAALDQLLLWPLLGSVEGTVIPPTADLEPLEQILREPPDDTPWIDAVRRRIDDGVPTICFCRHRSTASALRRHLGAGTAWVAGGDAGIGRHRVPRADLLALFGPGRAHWRLPIPPARVLVATEVLAEGLDLQGAGRIVHVDLPWHAMRMDQRVGRVWRIGQAAARVEVLRRSPAAPIERALAMTRRIREKRRIGDSWLDALTTSGTMESAPASATWLTVIASRRARSPEVVVVLGAGSRIGAQRFTLGPGGATARRVAALAIPCDRVRRPTTQEGREACRVAAQAWRAAMQQRPAQPAGRHALIARLIELARPAVLHRDSRRLARLDAWLALATRPGTHGLEQRLRTLPTLDLASLMSAPIPRVAPDPRPEVRSVLVLLYRREPTPLP